MEDEGHNAGPVKEQAAREMRLHVVPMDVVDDERECVDKSKDKEGIRGPSMEHLQLFVRDSCKEADPIGLACGRTGRC